MKNKTRKKNKTWRRKRSRIRRGGREEMEKRVEEEAEKKGWLAAQERKRGGKLLNITQLICQYRTLWGIHEESSLTVCYTMLTGKQLHFGRMCSIHLQGQLTIYQSIWLNTLENFQDLSLIHFKQDISCLTSMHTLRKLISHSYLLKLKCLSHLMCHINFSILCT